MTEIKLQHILTLAELLVRGARYNYVEITTKELGRSIGRSQQAASKHLLDLESDGYVYRIRKGQGFRLKVTEKGYDEMSKLFLAMKAALDSMPRQLRFEGSVVTGVGDGAYYMSLSGYREQFIEKLGFEPYPGTLNLKLADRTYINTKRELNTYPGVMIEGFSDGKRTYGWVKCYPARIDDKVDGALLILERTHHDDSIIEVISPVRIKDIAKIDYGDKLAITVSIPNSKTGKQS